jgi:hypothetical protein
VENYGQPSILAEAVYEIRIGWENQSKAQVSAHQKQLI